MQRVATWIIAISPESLRALWFRVRASPVGHRLARGTFWMVTGTVISRMLGLVSSIILARILGKVPFGELGTIQSTVGLFAAFAGLGIGITATKYVAEFRESETDRCGRVIGFSLGGALVGGILAGLGLVVFGGWLAADTLRPLNWGRSCAWALVWLCSVRCKAAIWEPWRVSRRSSKSAG